MKQKTRFKNSGKSVSASKKPYRSISNYDVIISSVTSQLPSECYSSVWNANNTEHHQCIAESRVCAADRDRSDVTRIWRAHCCGCYVIKRDDQSAASFWSKHSPLDRFVGLWDILMTFDLVSQRLAKSGAFVTSCETVLLQWVADKNHKNFKEIQGLIKTSPPNSGLGTRSKIWRNIRWFPVE